MANRINEKRAETLREVKKLLQKVMNIEDLDSFEDLRSLWLILRKAILLIEMYEIQSDDRVPLREAEDEIGAYEIVRETIGKLNAIYSASISTHSLLQGYIQKEKNLRSVCPDCDCPLTLVIKPDGGGLALQCFNNEHEGVQREWAIESASSQGQQGYYPLRGK